LNVRGPMLRSLQSAVAHDSLALDFFYDTHITTCGFCDRRFRGVVKRIVPMILLTMFTWAASTRGGLGAITATAMIGVGVALAEPQYGAPLYTAAFAGMAAKTNIPHIGWAALLGFFTSAVFEVFVHHKTRFFEGYGGRLGLIAVIANSITIAIAMGAGDVSEQPYFVIDDYKDIPLSWWLPKLVAPPVSACFTVYVRTNLKAVSNPVTASGFVGSFGDLLMRTIDTDWAASANPAFFAGTFVGMASLTRIPNYSAFVFVGFMCGALQIAFKGVLVGFGGHLGLTGFLASLIFILCFQWYWPVTVIAAPNLAMDDEKVSYEHHKEHRNGGKGALKRRVGVKFKSSEAGLLGLHLHDEEVRSKTRVDERNGADLPKQSVGAQNGERIDAHSGAVHKSTKQGMELPVESKSAV